MCRARGKCRAHGDQNHIIFFTLIYGLFSNTALTIFLIIGGYEVLNYHITVDYFENYHNTGIKSLCKYRHRSILYQKFYFTVTDEWLK